jgi:hypothetical protein
MAAAKNALQVMLTGRDVFLSIDALAGASFTSYLQGGLVMAVTVRSMTLPKLFSGLNA